MKVDKSEGFVQEPKLGPEDLGDDDATVLTIRKYEQFKKRDGQGMVRKLGFEETEKIHFLNQTQLQYVVDALGDETDEWIGKAIPLEIHHGKSLDGKRDITNLWVSAPESWNEVFRQAGLPEMPSLRPRVRRADNGLTVARQVSKEKATKARKVTKAKALGRTVKRGKK